ncbi:MAG: glutaredoxin family protein [bacterium]
MDADADKATVYFYRKRGCHLCDDMERALAAFRRESDADFRVVARDIESDQSWYRRYREYVPTLVLGEVEVCHYFFDQDELTAALSCN